ncbi:MAG: 50S ribosomal protein L35 [Patescibacteria group bacterium]|jgi:large subunit ribosomal protein L35
MPKLKTHKGTKKRFRLTGRNKVMHRTAGQDHFNTRESGNATRNKRRDAGLDKTSRSTNKKLIPYR